MHPPHVAHMRLPALLDALRWGACDLCPVFDFADASWLFEAAQMKHDPAGGTPASSQQRSQQMQ